MPFHFDDDMHIVRNPYIRVSAFTPQHILDIRKGISGRTRFAPMLSFGINYYFGGYDPFGYHLVNIFLHMANALLVFALLRMTLRRCPKNDSPEYAASRDNLFTIPLGTLVPFLGALLWAVHPLHTNSVNLVVQRMNLMMTCFYMTSLCCYIAGRSIRQVSASGNPQKAEKTASVKSCIWFAVSLLSGLLAFASKENSATLPFFIIVYEWFFFQNLNRAWLKKQLRWALPALSLLAVLFTWMLIYDRLGIVLAAYKGYGYTPMERVMTEWRVIIFYISLLLLPLPSRMDIDHHFPVSHSLFDPMTTLLSGIGLLALIVVAVIMTRKRRLAAFAVFWFLGNLVITSSIIPLDIIFEYRTYLPSVMVLPMIAVMLFRWLPKPGQAAAAISLLIVLLSISTLHRHTVWQDPVALWRDSVNKSPRNFRSLMNLGRSLAEKKQFDAAIEFYGKALAVDDSSALAHYNMGAALYAKGDREQAMAHYRTALRLDPEFAEAHNNLGVGLIDENKLEEGIRHYRKALKLDPHHPLAPKNLEIAEKGLAQINSKIAHAEKKLSEAPEDFETLARLAYLYYRKGRFKHAVALYQRVLKQSPNQPDVLTGLAAVHAALKQYDIAIQLMEKAVEQYPEKAALYYNLACLNAMAGKTAPAFAYLRKALDKGYDNRKNLETDPDLRNIRNTPAFRKLLAPLNSK